jgi:hypothetical protein
MSRALFLIYRTSKESTFPLLLQEHRTRPLHLLLPAFGRQMSRQVRLLSVELARGLLLLGDVVYFS